MGTELELKEFFPQIPVLYSKQANGYCLLFFFLGQKRPASNHFKAFWIFTEYNPEVLLMLEIGQQGREIQCQDWN